jgi:hypothetical protein
MKCAATAKGCTKDAIVEVQVLDSWLPLCEEHRDFARQQAVDGAMEVGNVKLVHVRPERDI